ncbi:MAG: hypothetical protein RBR16_13365 [Syntrophus sp. (in: bacteria)]|nr:hypothetical protein [Syntrophus sp. (in: bacteria)]
MKRKGQYPVDEEYVLQVSPYWSRALQLVDDRKARKFYLWDLFIVLGGMGLLYFIYMRFFG